MSNRWLASLVVAALAVGPAPGATAADAPATDFTKLDLSGSWYVLIHYKDAQSEDKSITKFKDFVWTVEQTANTLTWEHYPYVMFGEDAELVRRQAMRGHTAWEPDDALWTQLKTAVEVSSRALARKRLTGSVAQGWKSLAPLGSGGLNTMSFTRNWDVSMKPDRVSIVIVDSLSGTAGLGGMEEATTYEIRERVGDGELRGSYEEGDKRGTFRMVRSAERRVVK
jgi:hypothetical protein